MASRAIPAHLKPSAAEGEGFSSQRHHGKSQSHVVSTRRLFVSLPFHTGPLSFGPFSLHTPIQCLDCGFQTTSSSPILPSASTSMRAEGKPDRQSVFAGFAAPGASMGAGWPLFHKSCQMMPSKPQWQPSEAICPALPACTLNGLTAVALEQQGSFSTRTSQSTPSQ